MKWHWQYPIPFILLIFNIDWVLMPALQKAGLTGWLLFFTTSILALVELLIWYYWGRWFRRVALLEFAKRARETETVQEVIHLGKDIHADLKDAGMWDKIKNRLMDYSFGTFKKITDENSRFTKWLRRGGNLGLFILGINPEPGTRAIGATLCGATGWKTGLYPLAIGNVARVAYMVGLWQIIFKVFD